MTDQRDFQVGDQVQHPEFGDGLVLEARGSGDVASLLVSFDDKIKRRLAVRFAKLTLLTPAPAPTREPPRVAEPAPSAAALLSRRGRSSPERFALLAVPGRGRSRSGGRRRPSRRQRRERKLRPLDLRRAKRPLRRDRPRRHAVHEGLALVSETMRPVLPAAPAARCSWSTRPAWSSWSNAPRRARGDPAGRPPAAGLHRIQAAPLKDLIRVKRDGGALSKQRHRELDPGRHRRIDPRLRVRRPSHGRSPSAAWGSEETVALADAMLHSGRVLGWNGIGRPTVDKHSTGGVGDKISIALAPLGGRVRRRGPHDRRARPGPHGRHAGQAGGHARDPTRLTAEEFAARRAGSGS